MSLRRLHSSIITFLRCLTRSNDHGTGWAIRGIDITMSYPQGFSLNISGQYSLICLISDDSNVSIFSWLCCFQLLRFWRRPWQSCMFKTALHKQKRTEKRVSAASECDRISGARHAMQHEKQESRHHPSTRKMCCRGFSIIGCCMGQGDNKQSSNIYAGVHSFGQHTAGP